MMIIYLIFGLYFIICTFLIIIFLYEVYIKIIKKINESNLGVFESKKEWIQAMKKRALKDVYKMPKINGNLRFPRLISSRKIDKLSPIYSWQMGALILGLNECLEKNEVNKIIDDNIKYIRNLIGNEIDCAILFYAINKSGNNQDDIESILKSRILKFIDYENSTLMYRRHCPQIRFADTIGLVCPFISQKKHNNDNSDLKILSINQIKEFESIAFNKQYEFLPFHGFDMETSSPMGKYAWGRGVGWYVLGLIDTFCEVEEDEKNKLKKNILEIANSIKKYQKNNGGWGSTLTDKDSQTDTSATAMFYYFIKKAIMIKIISKEEFCECLDKAEICLMKNTNKKGMIMNTEGECLSLGNYSISYGYMPFTIGIALRALCME